MGASARPHPEIAMPDAPASTLPASIPAPPRGRPRRLNPVDRVLVEAQRALETVLGQPAASRDNPAGGTPDAALSPGERRHAAGLMRINHVGEVCAQGLYFGQAAVAREADTRAHLLEAAQEETDHLAWCAERLRELDSRPSLVNPLWDGGSYARSRRHPRLRGGHRTPGGGAPGRAPAGPARRRPAQPRDPAADEARRGAPCGQRRNGRRADPAATDRGADGRGLQVHEDRGLSG